MSICRFSIINFSSPMKTRWVATQIFLIFTPKIGANDPIWLMFFQMGLVQLPTRNPGLENGSFDPYCNGSANYLRFVGSSFDSICWKLGLLKLAMNFQWISASRKCCHNNFMKWLIYVDIMHLPKILLKSHFLELLHDYPRVTNTWNSVARNHSQPAIPILFSQKKRTLDPRTFAYIYIYI